MNIVAVSQANGEWFNALLELTQAYVDEMVAGIQQHLPNMDLESFIHLHGYHDLRQKYVDPGGNRIGFSWLVLDPEPQACISLAALEPGIAEVRALFVHPDGRNKGFARQLVGHALQEAEAKGFAVTRLDTLFFMQPAIRLYESFGFVPVPAYLPVAAEWASSIRFFERRINH